FHQLQPVDEVRRLGRERVAEDRLDAEIVVRVEVIGRNLDADALAAEAERRGEALEGGDRVLRLAAAPAMYGVDHRIRFELVALALARQDDAPPIRSRDEEALKGLVALGVAAGQPMDRDRMEGDEP